MKALICDLCGCVAPDIPEGSLIQAIVITRGTDKVLERDVCLTCLEKLIMGFEPPDANKIAPDANKVAPGVNKIAPDDSKAVTDPEPVKKAASQAKVGEMFSKICAHCGKPFSTKRREAKCCGHNCASKKWISDQKLKKQANEQDPAQKKQEQDELLKKIKRENPVHEIPEPTIYRQM